MKFLSNLGQALIIILAIPFWLAYVALVVIFNSLRLATLKLFGEL